MERNRCPACGSSGFNGRRCGKCYFETFTEEIAHGMHTHEGEPLVLKTVPTLAKREKGCTSFPGKKKRPNILWIIAVIYFVISVFAPLIQSADLPASDYSYTDTETEAAPEPISGGTVLYDDGEILITADWRDGDILGDTIWIQVDNRTDRDITVSTERSSVNGYMTDAFFFYCSAPEETLTTESLWVDEWELEKIGIDTVEELSFRLNLYDSNSYDTLAISEQITFHAAVPEDFSQHVDDSGTEVYSQDGLRIVYQGFHGEDLENGSFRFYMENASAQCLNIYAEEIRVNGESTDLFIWCELMPDKRGICEMDLYMLEEAGFETHTDIHTLELKLGISDSDNWNSYISTDWISIDIP